MGQKEDVVMAAEYARENWHWRDPALQAGPAVIFDIDGVLADAAGRQHFLDWGDWRSFFDACGDDPVIDEIERLLELLDASLSVILLTGRPRRVQPHTLAWLERYNIRWDVLIMRDYGDYSGVDEFKREALRGLIGAGFDVRLALDDDPKNHAMYVSEGVPCIYIHSGYYL
jgi:phosphoglycolate phosphatase-like HAD superfamily hydrolase